MTGAIIGDIVGSRFEFSNIKSKSFGLFTDECRPTDDSIMILAIAKAIMETEKSIPAVSDGLPIDREYCSLLESMAVRYMREIGRKYPDCGYGGRFALWISCSDPKPYNSFGNGAAMRISPVAHIAKSENEVRLLSEAVTKVTHNHREGLKGAEATAMAIYMARCGYSKNEIREKINKDYYDLSFRIDDIRDTYGFDETCQGSVPQAIAAFLESESFEDAIRTAVSLGGDSDTLAAIAGSIAEAYYGVPESLGEKALTYLDEFLRSIFLEWQEFLGYIRQKS